MLTISFIKCNLTTRLSTYAYKIDTRQAPKYIKYFKTECIHTITYQSICWLKAKFNFQGSKYIKRETMHLCIRFFMNDIQLKEMNMIHSYYIEEMFIHRSQIIKQT